MTTEYKSPLTLTTPVEVMRQLGARIKDKRLAANLTQAGLATRSGVSTGSIKRFESTGEISLKSLLKIALVLRCLNEMDELFKEDDKPKSLFIEQKPVNRKRGKIK